MVFRGLCYIVLVACAFAQDLVTVLSSQSGVSTFTQYLQQFPSLLDELNQGEYTGREDTSAALELILIIPQYLSPVTPRSKVLVDRTTIS